MSNSEKQCGGEGEGEGEIAALALSAQCANTYRSRSALTAS